MNEQKQVLENKKFDGKKSPKREEPDMHPKGFISLRCLLLTLTSSLTHCFPFKFYIVFPQKYIKGLKMPVPRWIANMRAGTTHIPLLKAFQKPLSGPKEP